MPDFDATNADAEQFGSFLVVLGAMTGDPSVAPARRLRDP